MIDLAYLWNTPKTSHLRQSIKIAVNLARYALYLVLFSYDSVTSINNRFSSIGCWRKRKVSRKCIRKSITNIISWTHSRVCQRISWEFRNFMTISRFWRNRTSRIDLNYTKERRSSCTRLSTSELLIRGVAHVCHPGITARLGQNKSDRT